jgi:Glycosyltransferase like family 2
VVFGGSDGSKEYLESLQDPRVQLDFEPARAGKWRAYNRAIDRAVGDIVYLVSSDVVFPSSALDHLAARFEPDVGVVFPRVVPTNIGGRTSRLGQALWDVHDRQIVEAERRGLPIHGGELQAVRRGLLEPLDGTINEDAYLCLRAVEQGYRVVYDREVVVHNTVPETLHEFLGQRTRVNYGHRQLVEAGLDPSTLDHQLWHRPGLCLSALGSAIGARPANAVRLPMLAGLEFVALVRGNRDFRRGVDHGLWSLTRSGKGSVFPSPGVDRSTAPPEK